MLQSTPNPLSNSALNLSTYAIQSENCQDDQQNYLNLLKLEMYKIMMSAQRDQQEYLQKIAQQKQQCHIILQERDKTIQQLTHKNTELHGQIVELKLSAEQMMRYLKRYQLKQQLLINQISHLSKTISQKQAIIHYLQEKNQTSSRFTNKGSSQSASMSTMDELVSTYGKGQLSFAKLKHIGKLSELSTVSHKHEANQNFYNEVSWAGQNLKTKRIKTQSNDVKENIQDNTNYQNVKKLSQLFTAKIQRKKENQQTLIKNTSGKVGDHFWRQTNKNEEKAKNRKNSTTSLLDLKYNTNFQKIRRPV